MIHGDTSADVDQEDILNQVDAAAAEPQALPTDMRDDTQAVQRMGEREARYELKNSIELDEGYFGIDDKTKDGEDLKTWRRKLTQSEGASGEQEVEQSQGRLEESQVRAHQNESPLRPKVRYLQAGAGRFSGQAGHLGHEQHR